MVGRDPDPQTAADLANTAAGAFITALNSTGAGIGLFGLQSPAEPPPAEQGNGLGTATLLAVGIGAGLVLGLALISLLLVLRRPVIEPADAEEMTGIATLGTVRVPRTRRGGFAPPEAFGGLVPVCRRLLAMPTPTVLVVGHARHRSVREQLSVAMASVMMRVRPVSFVGPTDAKAVLAQRKTAADPPEDASDSPADDSPADDGTRMTIVDSREPLDLVQPPHTSVAVLVVPVGIRSARLREAVVEHLGGSSESRIVLVRRGRHVHGETVVEPVDTGRTEPVEQPEEMEPADHR